MILNVLRISFKGNGKNSITTPKSFDIGTPNLNMNLILLSNNETVLNSCFQKTQPEVPTTFSNIITDVHCSERDSNIV